MRHQTMSDRTDRAVSPVIGVILMVAITVILAAVIGSFVLDLGGTATENAPQASISVQADTANDQLRLDHTGGDGLDSARTRVIIEIGDNRTVIDTADAASATVLSVGNTARVNASGAGTVDWDGDGAFEHSTAGHLPPIEGGDQVTVTIIDTATQRIIYETEVTA